MVSYDVKDLDVNPSITEKLQSAGVTLIDWLLIRSLAEIQEKAKLSSQQVKQAVKSAANKYSPLYKTASEMLKNHIQKLPTGCPSIDQILNGGLLCQGITELTGESACGKTQICLQTSLHCQAVLRNGLPCSCLYICTEDRFPSQRLLQMEKYYMASRHDLTLSSRPRFSDRVFVEHCTDSMQLLGLLENRVGNLLERGQTNLLVVDSLTALFRGQENQQSAISKSRDIASIAALLHQLASKYNICVLCVNQVTANMNPYSLEKSLPALGLSWANYVTTRLQVKRTSSESSARTLEVVFSPHLARDICQYTVTVEGVVDTTP